MSWIATPPIEPGWYWSRLRDQPARIEQLVWASPGLGFYEYQRSNQTHRFVEARMSGREWWPVKIEEPK